MTKPITEADFRAMDEKDVLKYVNGLSDDELREIGGKPGLAKALGGVLCAGLLGYGILFAFNPSLAIGIAVLLVLLAVVFSVLKSLSGGFFFFTF